MSSLEPSDKELIDTISKEKNTQVIEMSNQTEEGINNVKTTACEQLLTFRVEKKLKGKRINDVLNRIQITRPVPRDEKERSVSIPESVLKRRESGVKTKTKRKTEKEIELENGGPGVYNVDLKKNYILANDEWKYDIIPEIMDGKNISDFIDPEIDAKLAVLEAEEDEFLKKLEVEKESDMGDDDDDDEIGEEEREVIEKIKLKKKLLTQEGMLKRTNNKPQIPRKFRVRKLEKAEENLQELGLDTKKFRSRSQQRMRKRPRADSNVDMKDDSSTQSTANSTPSSPTSASSSSTAGHKARGRSRERRPPSRSSSVPRSLSQASIRSKSRERSLSRARSQTPKPGEGYRNVKQKLEASKLSKHSQRVRNLDGRKGEGDRHVFDLKPKHLFSGKRGSGKTDYR